MSRSKDLNDLRNKNNLELMNLCGTRIVFKDNLDSKIQAITSKETLDNVYIYSENKDKGYRESFIWDKEKHSQKQYSDEIMALVNHLLTFGGSSVCIPNGQEEDLNNILKYGQFWFGKSAKMMKGRPSQCHQNSCLLWDNNKDISRICTGYALSEDGIWRQHSWVVQCKPNSNLIIETTVKRVAYFGFAMNEEQSEEFYYMNV